MSEPVSIYDAKTQLSRLVARAEAGEEIVLSRHGKPVARITPLPLARPLPVPGTLKGRVVIHDDFDEYTDEDDRDWYGACGCCWTPMHCSGGWETTRGCLPEPGSRSSILAPGPGSPRSALPRSRSSPLSASSRSRSTSSTMWGQPASATFGSPTRIAEALRALPLHHRDPFDRMLIVQARAEGLTLVSSNPRFSLYEVNVLAAS